MSRETTSTQGHRVTMIMDGQLKGCREHVVDELISSEIKYLSYLRKVEKYFALPLSEHCLLPSDMHAEIFGSLTSVICVSETLLESILTFGPEEAFLMVSPCLKLYADYAKRYQTILVLLETCMTFSGALYRFIATQENNPDVNLQLPALLIMPIQRIPRYSLLLQELVLIQLQSDGLTSDETRKFVHKLLSITQDRQIVPEELAAHIMTMYKSARGIQPNSSESAPYPSLLFSRSLLRSLSYRSARLIAAFASVAATATYLNEQIRISDQSDMATLLQSKLLGRWTRNLLLVPGRRLLRYSLVTKVNTVTGRRQPRLLVLLSDILIYATPRRCRTMKLLMTRSSVAKQGQWSQSKLRESREERLRRPLRRKFIRSKPLRMLRDHVFQRSWLQNIARPSSAHVPECLIDLLANKNVRFSCIAVYPLHHCNIIRNFMPPTIDRGISFRISELPFIDECSTVNSSTDLVTPEDTQSNMNAAPHSNGVDFRENSALDESRRKNVDSIGVGYSFTVQCRDASFDVMLDSRSAAEDWANSLENAIRAVQLARQSLRKASSAKRPMLVSDFVQYEEWVEKRRAAAALTSCDQISSANAAECLGLYSSSRSRRLFNLFSIPRTYNLQQATGFKITCSSEQRHMSRICLPVNLSLTSHGSKTFKPHRTKSDALRSSSPSSCWTFSYLRNRSRQGSESLTPDCLGSHIQLLSVTSTSNSDMVPSRSNPYSAISPEAPVDLDVLDSVVSPFVESIDHSLFDPVGPEASDESKIHCPSFHIQNLTHCGASGCSCNC